jgi:hypothetical protein
MITKDYGDIIVVIIEPGEDFSDPQTLESVDGSKPTLVYQRHLQRGWSWTLLYERNGAPGELYIPGSKDDVDAALRKAREQLSAA